MHNFCRNCGKHRPDRIISENGKYMICPNCNEKLPLNLMPLFIITGASGVGKSTLSIDLASNSNDCIVMESDILWMDIFNTPEDNYRAYKELWLRMCKNISYGGKPVVLCGCTSPEDYERCVERRYFSEIHYIACVCDDSELERRLRSGRNVSDENWIKSSLSFNKWLKDNAENTEPKMTLLDTSTITVKEASDFVDKWIKERLT